MTDNPSKKRIWSANNRPSFSDLECSDPAAWQYGSLSKEEGLDIAKGLPEYWMREHRLNGAKLSRKKAEVLAAEHRRTKLGDVASGYSPLPNIFKGSSKIAEMQQYRTAGEKQSVANPFVLLHVQKESTRERCRSMNVNADSLQVHEDEWSRCANLYLSALVNPKRQLTCDKYLSQLVGSVDRLPDGALFVSGSRWADQKKLQLNFSESKTNCVRWGHLCYNRKTAFDSHFYVAGKTRAGKTTILKLLFQSLATNLRDETRYVFYDAKPDLLPCMFPPSQESGNEQASMPEVFLLNPFDKRCTAWHIAGDATSRVKAREIANIIFTGESWDNYFPGAACVIATATMDALNRRAGDIWTLYDLLCALQPENLQAVLESNPYGKQQFKTYFENPAASSVDLERTLAKFTSIYMPAAYAWTFAEESVSLSDWVRSQTKSIVISANDEYEDSIHEINRVILNLLCKGLLAIKEPPARTFLYLDELEHLGKIDSLKRVAEKGADLKVNLVLGLHDLDTLTDVYKKQTEGILGLCGFKAFLNIGNRHSTRWASEALGTQRVKLPQTSTQSGSTSGKATREADSTNSESSQTGESVTWLDVRRNLAEPDDLESLPMPMHSGSITGYFITPGHMPYKGTMPLATLLCNQEEYSARSQEEETNFYALWPKRSNVKKYESQPEERYEFPDDSFATLYALGFKKLGYTPDVYAESEVGPPDDSAPNQVTNDQENDDWDIDDIDYGFRIED